MKLDEIANDVGLDVNGDALLARGEQLVKLEVRGLEFLLFVSQSVKIFKANDHSIFVSN